MILIDKIFVPLETIRRIVSNPNIHEADREHLVGFTLSVLMHKYKLVNNQERGEIKSFLNSVRSNSEIARRYLLTIAQTEETIEIRSNISKFKAIARSLIDYFNKPMDHGESHSILEGVEGRDFDEKVNNLRIAYSEIMKLLGLQPFYEEVEHGEKIIAELTGRGYDPLISSNIEGFQEWANRYKRLDALFTK